MKKLFIAALLTLTFAASAFASDDKKVNVKIRNNFSTEFGDLDNVKWTVKSTYVKASFEVDGEKVEAFYDLNGESLGQSRAISLESLPVQAKRTFAKKYADYTVKEAIRFDGLDESAFYLSAENEKQSVILKITAAGISVFKKTMKN